MAETPREAGPREGLILLVFTVLALGASTFVLVSEESEAVRERDARTSSER